MSAILIHNARVVTMLEPGETRPPASGRRGEALASLGVLPSANVLIEGERIVCVETSEIAPPAGATRIDAAGRVVMPGFVDCHTHACWGGSRIDEWERRLAGATYQEIAAAGGGIMSTVRATRGTTMDGLAEELRERLLAMVEFGTTTIEVKSGYGLTAEHELKMLRAIGQAVADMPWLRGVIPTALLGHAVDPAVSGFVDATIRETLPAVSAAYPGIAIDAFCEKGAWTVEECVRLFEAAVSLGHPVRVHADQFTSMGMVERAIALGARSVDHLEASTEESLRALGASETFAVGLPACGFHLDGRYAAMGKAAAFGAKVCIATNFNPGSAPCPSMAFAIALAVRHGGLTPAQAIVAATLNPACLLGLSDRGYIAPGARGDVALLRHSDERALAYEVGGNHAATVIVGGEVVCG